MPFDERMFYTIKECAAYLRVGENAVRELVKEYPRLSCRFSKFGKHYIHKDRINDMFALMGEKA